MSSAQFKRRSQMLLILAVALVAYSMRPRPEEWKVVKGALSELWTTGKFPELEDISPTVSDNQDNI